MTVVISAEIQENHIMEIQKSQRGTVLSLMNKKVCAESDSYRLNMEMFLKTGG